MDTYVKAGLVLAGAMAVIATSVAAPPPGGPPTRLAKAKATAPLEGTVASAAIASQPAKERHDVLLEARGFLNCLLGKTFVDGRQHIVCVG